MTANNEVAAHSQGSDFGGSHTLDSGRRFRKVPGLLLLLSIVVAGAGCDSLDRLLEVELPGQVAAEDLDNPAFARTLVVSAQGDFECAFSNHVWAQAIWTTDFWVAGFTRTQNIVSLRDLAVLPLSGLGSAGNQPTCRQTNPPPLYMPFHTARVQAAQAIRFIEGFDQADITGNKNYLLGKANAYQGYSILLLAEAFCELTFDAGPVNTRDQAFQLAQDHFTSTLDLLSNVTSGPDVAEARALEEMARVGRARASLNLGDGAAVVADASLVTQGFVFFANRTPTSGQTRNHVFDASTNFGVSVTTPYHNLEVQGVPDPRVPVTHVGLGEGSDGVTDIWEQEKYTSRGDDLPLATWREAQLMIAEADPTQSVAIINLLRSNPAGLLSGLDSSAWPLPAYAGGIAAEIAAQVIEERRRELWLQGTRLGDMLRNDIPFTTGFTPKGEPYGLFTCMPLPERETLANDNTM